MEPKKEENKIEFIIPYLAQIYEPKDDEKINELLDKLMRRIFYIPLEEYLPEENQKLPLLLKSI